MVTQDHFLKVNLKSGALNFNSLSGIFIGANVGTLAGANLILGGAALSTTGPCTLVGPHAHGLTLNSGSLAAKVINATDGGSQNLYLNGGTLTAIRAGNLIDNTLSSANLGGSMTIDDGGFSANIDMALVGSGNLTKIGNGTLTFAGNNTYSGNTIVNSGSVKWNYPCLSATSDLRVASGVTLLLNHAQTHTIKKLWVNSRTVRPGLYNSSNQPAGVTISGAGSIQVTDYITRGSILRIE